MDLFERDIGDLTLPRYLEALHLRYCGQCAHERWCIQSPVQTGLGFSGSLGHEGTMCGTQGYTGIRPQALGDLPDGQKPARASSENEHLADNPTLLEP